VFRYVDTAIRLEDSNQPKVRVGSLYKDYVAWCRDENHTAVGKISFSIRVGSELKARFPNLKTSKPHNQLTVAGNFRFVKLSSDSTELGLAKGYLFDE
jgi:hypothetical protein